MPEVVEGKRPGGRRYFGILIKLAVTAAIVVFLAGKVNWRELQSQMLSADVPWLLAALAASGAGLFSISLRWWFLLLVQEIRLRVRTVYDLVMIGAFFNTFMMGATGGDIVKIYYILKEVPDRKAKASLSLVMDRGLGLLLILISGIAMLPWHLDTLAQSEKTRLMGYGLVGLFVLAASGVLGLLLFPLRLVPEPLKRQWDRLPEKFRDLATVLWEGFHAHARRPRLLAGAVLFGLGNLFAIYATGYCLAKALHMPAGFGEMIVIMALTLCMIGLPISFGGHVVREAVFVLLFGLFGVISLDPGAVPGTETALAFSALFFGAQLLWGLVGGIFYLLRQQHLKHQPEGV
jgi:uncharacterized membrane protein YbhN (UPF0104 family)